MPCKLTGETWPMRNYKRIYHKSAIITFNVVLMSWRIILTSLWGVGADHYFSILSIWGIFILLHKLQLAPPGSLIASLSRSWLIIKDPKHFQRMFMLTTVMIKLFKRACSNPTFHRLWFNLQSDWMRKNMWESWCENENDIFVDGMTCQSCVRNIPLNSSWSRFSADEQEDWELTTASDAFITHREMQRASQ